VGSALYAGSENRELAGLLPSQHVGGDSGDRGSPDRRDGGAVHQRGEAPGVSLEEQHRSLMGVDPPLGVSRKDGHRFGAERAVAARIRRDVAGHQAEEAAAIRQAHHQAQGNQRLAPGESGQRIAHDRDAIAHWQQPGDVLRREHEDVHQATASI
jgi:hypothetical protein